MGNNLDARLDRVAALGEPVRRALYRFVVAQPEPVTRERAAAGATTITSSLLGTLRDDARSRTEFFTLAGLGQH